MTGSGGWPLTILMTPEQKPFFAATYFPKKSRQGYPGLMDLLEQCASLWETEREKLLEVGNQIADSLRKDQASASRTPDTKILRKAYSLLQRSCDMRFGGFGSAPKFPTPHNLLFLMHYSRWENASDSLKMALIQLDAMARGGIHDHIGGGFSRYSTDKQWLVPHFEKMLYDNALLIPAYLEAYQMTGNAHYADVAQRTVNYILRELTDPAGGFYCGQDADSDGVEGKYYVFTPEEIIHLLGEKDGNEFCRRYNITEGGNFEGKSIPNRIGQSNEAWPMEDPRLEKLYAYRKERTQLHRDDKILLSWNAWTIIALVRAGLVLDEPRYLDAAQNAQRFIETHLKKSTKRLYLRYRNGEAAHDGQLEDCAVYALALIELYRCTFDPEYLKQAIHWASQMVTLFEDQEQGGYYINAKDAEQLIARPKEIYDGAIPSGNSVSAMVLEQLASMTGEVFWREAADRQQAFLAGQIADYPAGHCFGLLAMGQSLYPHRELICASDSIPPELMAYLRGHPTEDLSILVKTAATANALSECAPFTADYPIPEHGTVWYLCENGACKAPITDFSQLKL